MKSKKIITMISAVAMAATMTVTSLAGCDSNKHKHSYAWEINQEATCTTPGQKTGTCGCGDVKTEEIPIDPNAHRFDNDWAVTKPDDDTKGRATRTCNLNSAHTFDVELPKLSEKDKYDSVEETAKPSYIAAGNCHYVLFHPAGDIEFDIEIPKHDQIENLNDVVLYAWSLSGNIRRSDGHYVEGDPNDADIRRNDFYNYYGNDYTRVHDGGNRYDFWYSRDNEDRLYGIAADCDSDGNLSNPRVDESVTEEDFLGYGYNSGGGMRVTYGAEDTLLAYYEASQSENAIKYNESYSESSNGSYACSFSFSRLESEHFCRYYVDFTTYSTGEINTLSVKTKIIRRWMLANTYNGTNVGEIIYDDDGDIIFSEIYPISNTTGEEMYETNYVYEKDESGKVIYDPVYEYEKKENGKIKYDDEGDPVIAKDENGDPVTVKDDDGNVVYEPRKTYTYEYTREYEYETDASGDFIRDEEGNKVIKTDENGEPIYAKDKDGNYIMVIAKDVNGAKIKTPVVGDPAIFIDGFKQKPDGTLLLDANGDTIARPIPLGFKEGDVRKYYYEEGDQKPGGGTYDSDHPYVAIREINFTQTLKVAGEKVVANPYPAENVYIHSFDVRYNGELIEEGATVQITANTAAEFKITDITPADTAKLDFDPITVYLKTASSEILLGPTGDNAYGLIGHFMLEDKHVLIRAQQSGTFTVIFRTRSGRYERELTLNVLKSAPSELNAQAYLYSDAGGSEKYTWTDTNFDFNEPSTALTVYEGRSLYIRATAIASEANSVDTSFVTALEDDAFAQYISLEDNVELADGTKVTKITALSAIPDDEAIGVFVLSVHKNDKGNPVATKLIGIKVVAAPSVDDMFTGSYTGRFNNINMVESGPSVAADVAVTFTPATATTGTMNVKVTSGKNTVTCVYSYAYDVETREFTGTFVSGRSDATFQFTFALNEKYKLSIHHLTFPNRNVSETIVLSRPQSD